MQTALLVVWQGCRKWSAAKRLVFGGLGPSWVVGACPGDVLGGLAVCVVVLWLRATVLNRVVEPSPTDTSLMTWQPCWLFRAQRGVGERAGGCRVVQGCSWIVVDDGGAGRVDPLSVQHVQMNTSVRPRVTEFPGL